VLLGSHEPEGARITGDLPESGHGQHHLRRRPGRFEEVLAQEVHVLEAEIVLGDRLAG